MKITRTSMLSGKENTMDLPVTAPQMLQYKMGIGLIQNVFPDLTAEQREFIKTGITPEEWDANFKEEDEA